MAYKFASSLIVTIIVSVSVLPIVFAGPACARRHWQGQNCIEECQTGWGWPGRAMGADPWGAVMKPGPTDMVVIIAQACGTAAGYATSYILWTLTHGSFCSAKAGLAPSTTSSNATQTAIAIPVASTYATLNLTSSSTSTSSAIAQHSSTSSSSALHFSSSLSSASYKHSSSPGLSSPKTPKPSPSPSPSLSSTKPKPSNKSPTQAVASSSGAFASDISQYLSAHNSVRTRHGASDLTWSDTLASVAQQWADGCKFTHSGGSLGPYGGRYYF